MRDAGWTLGYWRGRAPFVPPQCKELWQFFHAWASTNLIKKTPINESFTDRSSVNKVRKALGATLIAFSGLSSTAFSHTLRIVYGCSRTEGHSSTIATHQEQLAEKVGVTTNSIARQERGELGIRESLHGCSD
jgi:hypothetical protein